MLSPAYHRRTALAKFRAVAAPPARGMLAAMARAMVLSAGLGTRLRPLTDELPKPLLPLGDRSLLEHALLALVEADLGPDVVINVHHLAAAFDALTDLPLGVVRVHEERIRGTAGGVAGARALLGPAPVVVMIGDAVLGGVPADFAESARGGGLVLAVQPREAGQGNVGVGADGGVVRLRGERFGVEASGGEYVGLFALGARALAELPEHGCYVADYALPLLRAGGRVATYTYDRPASFPGDDVASYFAANLAWLGERSVVAPSAAVAPGVELDRVLVAPGARLGGSGRAERVVLLPGARAHAPLTDAIVLPSGRVVTVMP